MAVRINASADYLSRSANIPSTSAITMCCWWRFIADGGNDVDFFLGISDGVGEINGLYQGSQNSIRHIWDNPTGYAQIISASSGNWYFAAFAANSTDQRGYAATVSAASCSSHTSSGAPASYTPVVMFAGGVGNATYWSDCRVAALKVWDAKLSAAEIENERWSITPVRTANLNTWAPLVDNNANDYGPNGRDWTENGTLSWEDGPPCSWGASPVIVGETAAAAAAALPPHLLGVRGARRFMPTVRRR